MSTSPPLGWLPGAYKAFRPSYPDTCFELILAAVPADRRHRAMDLGAGVGISTQPLCRWFDEVIAVEKDPAMAEQMRGLNEKIVVRNVRAEDCVQEPESVDLVTVATSFYWMDGPRVIENVARWLRPGGVFAAYRYIVPRYPAPIQMLVERELHGNWAPFIHERLKDPDYSRRTLLATKLLGNFEIFDIPYSLQTTAREVAGFFLSSHYEKAYLQTLADPERYLREFEEELHRAAPSERFEMDIPLELILAYKGGPHSRED